MQQVELNIDKNFQELIPPLSEAEYAALEQSILQEGCRDALVIWGETVIDGHNRYRICDKHQVYFDVLEKHFDSISDAKVWIIDNQKARRNLTDGWKWQLAQTKKEILAEKGKEQIVKAQKRRREREKSPPVSLSKTDKNKTNKEKSRPELTKHNTRDEIAADLGWSTGKTAQADYVWNKASDEIKQQTLSGDLSINQAYQVVKKKEKKEEVEQKKQENSERIKKSLNPPLVSCEHYESWLDRQNPCDLLLTDPPYSTEIDDIRTFAAHWLPMALSKVKPTGRAYVFIGAYPEELQAYINVEMPSQILVWTYRNTLGPQPKYDYIRNLQFILYYKMDQCPPLNSPIIMEQISVQDFNHPARTIERHHSWEKPLDLAERFIRHSTQENQLVLDPFCCSGTFVLAASQLGRVGRGCDISEENLEIARRRGCITAK